MLGDEKSNEVQIKKADEFPESELLSLEKETTGLYMSGHPTAKLQALAKQNGCMSVCDIAEGEDGQRVKILAIITKVKRKITKSDTTMAFVTVEDVTGSVEMLVFPKIFALNVDRLTAGSIYVFSGRLSLREDEQPSIVLDAIEDVNELPPKPKKQRRGVFIRFASSDDERADACRNILVRAQKGNMPVSFFFAEERIYEFSVAEVEVNTDLIEMLKDVSGDENVVVNY